MLSRPACPNPAARASVVHGSGLGSRTRGRVRPSSSTTSPPISVIARSQRTSEPVSGGRKLALSGPVTPFRFLGIALHDGEVMERGEKRRPSRGKHTSSDAHGGTLAAAPDAFRSPGALHPHPEAVR